MDDHSIPPEHQNRLSLRFVIDTHILDDGARETDELWRLHRAGWFNLTRTDVLDTELLAAPEERRSDLLARSGELTEHFGPLVLDHSRLDHAVLGGRTDEELLHRVFALLYPGAVWGAARPQHTRDAMHVAWAIRYGADGFITRDRRLLNKREAVARAFDGFLILEPAETVDRINRRKRREDAILRTKESS